MNLALKDVGGELLIVSQFTLYANCADGNRPSFTDSAKPEKAKELYEYFCEECSKTGIKVENIVSSLLETEEIYKIPFTDNKYETSSIYLSGYVKEKLAKAKLAAKENSEFNRNVEALEKVQPKNIPYNEIFVTLGSTWVPTKYYEEFMHELLETPAYAKNNCNVYVFKDKYYVSNKNISTVKSINVYGTHYKNAYEIYENALNMINTKVYDYIETDDGKTRAVVNTEKTQIVQSKQEEIKQKFTEWIWEDSERREYLVNKYNAEMNNIVERVPHKILCK